MPAPANVKFNVQNFTKGVSTPLTDIFFVEGITKRGPVSDPKDIITSWPDFQRLFGGLLTTSDFPLLCKRALKRGSKLRVNRVTHYTSNATTAVKAPALNVTNDDSTPVNLFTIQPKYHGVDYNNITVKITAASNANASYFDIQVVHANEADLTETYTNIKNPIASTASNQTFLDDVKVRSQLIDFGYIDCTSVSDLHPEVADYAFVSGADGDAVVDADYAGVQADGNGFYAFDNYDDANIIACPEISTATVNAAGAAYAAARQDLVFFAHLSNAVTTAAALVTARDSVTPKSKFSEVFAGGIKLRDETTLQEISKSEMGDVLGIAAFVHGTLGPWFSLAGLKSRVDDAIGVVTNFGTPAKATNLTTLAQSQINVMCVKNGVVQLSGNFSGQIENDLEKFASTVFLIIYLKKALRPVFESYLEEPNDPQTWKAMYNHVKPFLDSLAGPEKRALWKYEYIDDHDANSLSDLQVNTATDVQNGKYKINLKIWPIASLQELTINIMIVQGAEGSVTVE